jgi:hypothetical protein
MLTGRITITQHAADRYVKRIDRSLTQEKAMQLLAFLAPTAAPLRERTIMGQEQWKIEAPFPCVLVVKRDKGIGAIPVVVTVFDAPQGGDAEPDEIDRIVNLQALECRAKKPVRSRGVRRW